MYSNERSVQILISLLKEFGINKVVLSPGGSDAPIIRSFQYDKDFSCYSVVDERNAAYVAMGMAQESGNPVVCVCTAGTAVCNYVPGITEAFYQNVPVIAITSDQHPYLLNQLELQKIKQDYLFEGVVKKEVTLPSVNTDFDEWQCNRIVNEALLSLNHHGAGPVHINVPIVQTLECNQSFLPKQRKIVRYDCRDIPSSFLAEHLMDKKVLVVVGENTNITDEDISLFETFFERYNCVFSVETISNLKCMGCVTTYPVTETGVAFNKEELVPDIVISIGNFIASYKLKQLLKSGMGNIENWLVNNSGEICDPYWSLKYIFEGEYRELFKQLLDAAQHSSVKHNYFEDWNAAADSVVLGELPFSSMSIAKMLSEEVPEHSILHTAILNSTRITQFFEFKNNVKFYCNLGALGIDGCVATFIGHSLATEKLSYLLIGDLSFFYGMNGIGIKGIGSNVRIILLNNGGGEEFKIKLPYPQEEMTDFICAQKNRIAKGWVESLGYRYFTAKTNDEVRTILQKFAEPSDAPLFLEIFLSIDNDSKIIRDIYQNNLKKSLPLTKKIPNGIKRIIKRTIK